MIAPDEPSQVRMLVDADTDLPQTIDVTEKDGTGKVKESSVIRMRFGGQLGSSVALPKIPKNAKVTTLDLSTMVSGAMNQAAGQMKGMDNIGQAIDKAMKDK